MEKITDVHESKHQKGYAALERSIKHYSNFHQILLVGEGDFSFSLALANAFGSAENMRVLSSYKTAHITLSKLESLGATILHGVDATKMEKHHIIGKRSFDRIVYNFPHAGFYGRETDKAVIKKHRHLMKNFFKNASTVLSTMGEIHVTHKSHHPYDKWKLVKHTLLLKESVQFSIADYPGYVNKRGAGNHAGKTFLLGECRTYKFILSPAILHQRELMGKAAASPEFFSEFSIENYMQVIMELKPERQAREAAEKEKADLEAALNDLKKIADDNTKKSAELTRQRNDAVHQKAQACSEKENIAEKLIEALKSSREEIKRKESRFEEAILEIEVEKQARKITETAKADLENPYSHLEMLLGNEQKKNDELKRQRDEVIYQKEEICKEKTDIAKQLDEAHRKLSGSHRRASI